MSAPDMAPLRSYLIAQVGSMIAPVKVDHLRMSCDSDEAWLILLDRAALNARRGPDRDTHLLRLAAVALAWTESRKQATL